MPNSDGIEFSSNLGNVLSATEKAVERAAEIIGGMIESKAKENITDNGNVDTGLLRNSITHGIEGGKTSISSYKADRGSGSGSYSGTIPKGNDSGTVVVVGTNVFYAPFIELGTGKFAEGGGGQSVPWKYKDEKGNWYTTSGYPPHPFLRPAVEGHADEYRQVLAQELSEIK